MASARPALQALYPQAVSLHAGPVTLVPGNPYRASQPVRAALWESTRHLLARCPVYPVNLAAQAVGRLGHKPVARVNRGSRPQTMDLRDVRLVRVGPSQKWKELHNREQCPGGQGTFEQGANHRSLCVCLQDERLTFRNSTGKCVPCGIGLRCDGGNQDPIQAAGFWVDIVDPVSMTIDVFRCRSEAECPEGPLGTCARGTHREGLQQL